MNAASRRPIRHAPTDDEPAPFGCESGLPEGFRYQADLLTVDEEERLKRELAGLPFKPFDFHGYLANRQVVAFGFRYDYGRREVLEAEPLPSFLEPVRKKIAEAFGRPADAFQQVLINEYRAGAGIGWHRDKPRFADRRAALRLFALRSGSDSLGTQRSAARPPSLFDHLSDASRGVSVSVCVRGPPPSS
jgi:alkylated DNA repair dioxygenase AlkB